MRPLHYVVGTLVYMLASCAPRTVPTPGAAEVQTSAAVLAATMIAWTQEALPPTLIPAATLAPSATPLPTLSLNPYATIASPTGGSQTGEDNCRHSLDTGQAGPLHKTLVRNETSGTANLSLSLYKKNAFGQCGTMYLADLGKNSSAMAQLPSGSWYAYAWGTLKKGNFKSSGSFFVQPAQFAKIELCIREANIVYKPQC
jgi:hypothetical protein